MIQEKPNDPRVKTMQQMQMEHPVVSTVNHDHIHQRLQKLFGRKVKMLLYAANYENPHQALEQYILMHKKQQHVVYIAYHENGDPMITIHVPQLEESTINPTALAASEPAVA